MQAHWGIHSNEQKPESQAIWDKCVVDAISSIFDEGGVVASASSETDLRPKLYDQISGKSILVDTGASKSCWPRTDFPHAPIDPFKALKAVNDSHIPTYGVQTIKIQPSKFFTFSHDFILANLSQPVIGWDYLAAAKLNVVWKGQKCFLMKGSQIKAQLHMAKVDTSILSLAPITTDTSKQTLPTVPTKYKNIIDKYPNLQISQNFISISNYLRTKWFIQLRQTIVNRVGQN